MFTSNQIEEIRKKLQLEGVKDSALPEAHPLTGKESIAVVQSGQNRKVGLDAFITSINNWCKADFLNLSKEGHSYTVEEAIAKTSPAKLGQVITFSNKKTGSWSVYQYTGETLEGWNDIDNWANILDTADYHFRGYFFNEELLKKNYPRPQVGDFAFIGTTLEEAVTFTCISAGNWYNTNYPALTFADKFKAVYSEDFGVFDAELEETLADRANKDAVGNVIHTYYASNKSLQETVSKEAVRAKEAEETNAKAISDETKARVSADTTLQGNIDKEATRAKQVEGGLQTNIDKKQDKLTADIGIDIGGNNTISVDTKELCGYGLACGTTGAIDVDTNEIARAKDVDAVKTSVNNEMTRAKQAEQANADAIKAVKETVDTLSIEDLCAYGIEFDTTVSSPTCTRIGNMSLHKSLPVQSRIRGCLLDDDGNVVEYLDQNDWTDAVRDGSRGQVMVELPMHYRRFITDGNKRRVMLSEWPLSGYHVVPKAYVSAYEAALDRTNSKLASVVNETKQYRGGTGESKYDNTYRTFLGRPVSAIGRSTFRSYARARKQNSAEWNCMTYDVYKELWWLFVVEYATLNSQAPFHTELTSEGYRQGGLGIAFPASMDKAWANLCESFPFMPCGYTDNLGNGTGIIEYTATNDDAENPVTLTVNAVRYHGIENPFSHCTTILDGANIYVPSNSEEEDFGKLFVCHDPAKFSDSGYDDYSLVGNVRLNEGFIKEIIFGEGGEILATTVGGGSTTYFCDYHHEITRNNNATLKEACMGGSSGERSGFLRIWTFPAQGIGNAFGSRLCFIPADK